MKKRGLGVLLLLGSLNLSCDAGPKAGEILVNLVTPSNSDGAILFRVEAAEPHAITGVSAACAACQVFSHNISDTELGGVVTGAPASGPFVRIAVSDAQARQAYTVTVVQVAGRDHRLRSPIGYELELEK